MFLFQTPAAIEKLKKKGAECEVIGLAKFVSAQLQAANSSTPSQLPKPNSKGNVKRKGTVSNSNGNTKSKKIKVRTPKLSEPSGPTAVREATETLGSQQSTNKTSNPIVNVSSVSKTSASKINTEKETSIALGEFPFKCIAVGQDGTLTEASITEASITE